MILELKYMNVVPENKKFEVHDKEKLTINYNSYADIKAQEGTIERFKAELSTLVIWGTHGSASNLCNLTAEDIESLKGVLSKTVFNTIVLDACESALYAKAFASLLSEKGIVLCHMGICPAQIMTSDKFQESEIRTVWKKNIKKQIKSISTYCLKGVFPAIYHKSGAISSKPGAMHHLVVKDMPYESYDDSDNPFNEDALKENVGNTESCVVTDDQAFFKFMD